MRFALVLAVVATLSRAAAAQTFQLKSDRTPEQRAAAFDAADVNKDGKLNLDEFRDALDPKILVELPDEVIIRLKDQRDTDKDGFVSRAEFLATDQVDLHL